MKTVWQNFSSREQWLVAVAGGLGLVLIVALGLVRPLMASQSESETALAASIRTYSAVASAAAEIRQLPVLEEAQPVAGSEGQSSRVIISVAARRAGVVISRIQPTEDGALTLWVDNVASQSLFGWLNTLEEEHRLTPDQVSLQRTGNGSLRAQVQFPGAAT